MGKSLSYPVIEAERARRGITKRDLCKLLHVTYKTYCGWQSGSKLPIEKAVEIANLFEVSLDYLVKGE